MKISFRAYTLDDAPAFRASLDDPVTARFTGTIPSSPTLEWARNRILAKNYGDQEGDTQEFGLFIDEGAGEVLVGGAGWFINGDGQLEIGYGIHPDHRGKGHAGRALDALVAYLRTAKGHEGVIWAGVDQTNAASIRVLERAGFELVGPWVFTHPIRHETYDQWIYKLAALS